MMIKLRCPLFFLMLIGSTGCGQHSGQTVTSAHTDQVDPSPISRAKLRTDLLNTGTPLADLISEKPIRTNRIGIKIEKSRYRLTVYYRNKEIKSYPVVLGGNPIDDKLQEGDSCTPEGHFKLTIVRRHRSWSKFMLLDYPTAVSRQRFAAAKRDGTIPKDATIGGAVGIHGVPNHADYAIDRGENWTAGCISLKTHDIDEIYPLCRIGTPVHIVH